MHKIVATNIQTRALDILKNHFPDLQIEAAGGMLDGANATLKFKFTIGGAEALEADAKRKFEQSCGYVGLLTTDYKREFEDNGRKFKLVSIELNRPKFPFVGVAADGKRFKFTKVSFS